MTSETPHAYLGVLVPQHKLNMWGDLANKLHSVVVRCCVVCMSGLSQSKIVYTNMLPTGSDA